MSEPLPSATLPRDPIITVRLVCETVAAFYDMQVPQLFGAVRRAYVALPRQVAMHVAYVHCKLSLPTIGRIIGRDHTTVLYAHHKIAAKRVEDAEFNRKVSEIETMVLNCAAALANLDITLQSDINATAVARRIVDSTIADTLVSLDEIRAMARFILSCELAEQPPLPTINSTYIQETRA